jgi:hypothetical protein
MMGKMGFVAELSFILYEFQKNSVRFASTSRKELANSCVLVREFGRIAIALPVIALLVLLCFGNPNGIHGIHAE